jgi:hypothetical protein
MPSIPTQETVLLDLIALIVVGYLAIRQFREKQTHVGRLWVLPALALLFSYTSIQHDLFDTALSPAIIGAGFVVGLAAGGVRGAVTKLTVDPSAGVIRVKGTPLSVALWLALLAVKGIADVALVGLGKETTAAGIATGLITATLLSFSLAAIIATRVYFYWRYSLAAVDHV